MENKGVLVTAPMPSYLEQELGKRFRLFKLWEAPFRTEFLERNSESISAVVGNAAVGADSELIDSLPNLEIVSNYSVGLDKIDLVKWKERGISVTNTPDVVTDDIADIAIGLTLAKICAADGFLRSGLWKSCDFDLTRSVCEAFPLSLG